MQLHFFFPVDLNTNRGDSLHVKHLFENGSNLIRKNNLFTLKDKRLSSKIYYYITMSRYILNRNEGKIYIRYSLGIFLICLLHIISFSKKQLFFELNAVIIDEIKDSNTIFSMKYLIAFLDEIFLLKNRYLKICVTAEIKKYYKPNSVLVENCVKIPNNLEEIIKLDIKYDKLKIIFVGTFEPWQDLYTLIFACKKLKDSHIEFTCRLIGDGSMFNLIKKLIKNLDLEEDIILTGRLLHHLVLEEISYSNIAIAPLKGSRLRKTGSSALKVYEYLLLNKYTLITSCGTFSDTICSLGFGSEFKNSDELYEQLILFYKNPKKINSSGYIIKNHSYTRKVQDLSLIIQYS